MATPADALRAELKEIHQQKLRGDLRDKDFQKRSAERTVELYRAVVNQRLARGESILAEHHTVRGHFRFSQSVLREPEQQAESLFLTGQRLLRLRSTLRPDRPPSCNREDGTIIEEVPLRKVRGLRVRREVRFGEVAAGLVIIVLALVFWQLLLFTGKALLAIGAAGVLHGSLLPTRWVEVVTATGPVPVLAARRKSGRLLLRLLRQLHGEAAHG